MPIHLVHLPDQSIDPLLPITVVTTLNVVQELPRVPSASWVAKLERPQEVACLLEVGANREDLVNEILHTHNAQLAEVFFDDGIVGQGDALLVDLAITALVDKLLNGFQVRLSVSDIWLDNLEHLGSGLCDTDENTVVDLQETHQLHDLARLRGNFVDTFDTDNEQKFWLLRNVKAALLLCNTSKTDLLALCIAILLHILLGTLEDDTALLFCRLESQLSPKLKFTAQSRKMVNRRHHRHI